MKNVCHVSTARTALAKSCKGALNMTHGATLGAMWCSRHRPRRVDPRSRRRVAGLPIPKAPRVNIARQSAIRAGWSLFPCDGEPLLSSGLQTICDGRTARHCRRGRYPCRLRGKYFLRTPYITSTCSRGLVAATQAGIYWPMLQTAKPCQTLLFRANARPLWCEAATRGGSAAAGSSTMNRADHRPRRYRRPATPTDDSRVTLTQMKAFADTTTSSVPDRSAIPAV